MPLADAPVPHVTFAELTTTDLVVDAVYAGGSSGHTGDDPMSKIIKGIGNQGGFRYAGSPALGTVKLAVLYTSGGEVDWPDYLDVETGTFTYYGDNRRPGQSLHETPRSGNILLRDAFAASHGTPADRSKVPPFFLFEKAAARGRSVLFRGLLAPGGPNLTSDDELAAIWRATDGRRFQNYRARFTVLEVDRVPRAWIQHLLNGGDPLDGECPDAWRTWTESRVYRPLLAPSTTVVRSKADQLPGDAVGKAMLQEIRDYFRGREHDFELCAVAIWRLMAPSTGAVDVTRPSRDGGRDAVGTYLLGPAANRIAVDFALEAKCYGPDNSVGVREVSRLISRLRHRNFGVLVTTSFLNKQVQDEIQEDGHPIALVCGRDIVEVLRQHGRTTADSVRQWLTQSFPQP
ncbi:restriction endonuclease superfamily protein [Streptomyces griseoflavus Tu4000]|uniref:Restriction endonuclease superfamily protein n=1 Tax=Streptomyces griseoflavus Tu4000 TaxID=467200 RepID=D9XJL6_9ACTN|nr:restriction endonuclease superfamily protein [Streptomyces griseoflavus Tu4000]